MAKATADRRGRLPVSGWRSARPSGKQRSSSRPRRILSPVACMSAAGRNWIGYSLRTGVHALDLWDFIRNQKAGKRRAVLCMLRPKRMGHSFVHHPSVVAGRGIILARQGAGRRVMGSLG